jgi:hypothetical protein
VAIWQEQSLHLSNQTRGSTMTQSLRICGQFHLLVTQETTACWGIHQSINNKMSFLFGWFISVLATTTG